MHTTADEKTVEITYREGYPGVRPQWIITRGETELARFPVVPYGVDLGDVVGLATRIASADRRSVFRTDRHGVRNEVHYGPALANRWAPSRDELFAEV